MERAINWIVRLLYWWKYGPVEPDEPDSGYPETGDEFGGMRAPDTEPTNPGALSELPRKLK